MRSSYLDVLNSSIAEGSKGINTYYLRAERAAYLARLGETSLARDEVKFMQAENRIKADARLSVLTNIADGLCHYYDNMGNESRDRLLRAYSIAKAAKISDLTSRAATWLALLAYGAYDFDAMVMYLGQSMTPDNTDRSSRARALLTVATTTHLANRFDLAKPWYHRARYFAAEIGDGASISAIMHNMASIWSTNLRNAALGGIETADKSRMALLGVISTMNFDDLVGGTSLPSFTPLVQAQILSIDGKVEEALGFYDVHLTTLRINAVPGWQKWLLADRAWCLLKMGYADRARNDFDALFEALSEGDHVDDVAATLTRLSDGYRLLGFEERSRQCGMRAQDRWLAFSDLQGQMLQKVARFSPWLTDR